MLSIIMVNGPFYLLILPNIVMLSVVELGVAAPWEGLIKDT
jgi:hypothetical protein